VEGWRPWQSIVPTEASRERLGILRRRIMCPSGVRDLGRSTPWQWWRLHNICPDILICSGSLNRLVGPGRCLSIFLSGPGLELIDQSFGSWLIDFGLVLKGRSKSGNKFIARWGPWHGLSAGG
jgi:hypothetical protein